MRNTLKVLKRDGGEGWMRSVGPIVWLYRVKKEMSILCTMKQRLTIFVISY